MSKGILKEILLESTMVPYKGVCSNECFVVTQSSGMKYFYKKSLQKVKQKIRSIDNKILMHF